MHRLLTDSRRLVASLAAVALVLAVPALADRWYEHYARAEQALAEENWTRAVAELNEAIGRKGDSGARERSYGMRVVAYFPYLKLGIAYTELGQHDAALQAFDTEARLGAIQGSEEALDELQRFRRQAQEGRQKSAAGAARQIPLIVAQSLQEAESLEKQGRLQEAVSAAGRALAVAPESPEATAFVNRLRVAVAAQERARQEAELGARLLAEAGTALAERRYAGAASLLRQVLAQGPNDRAEALLRQAEDGMRTALTPGGSPEQLQSTVSEMISGARELAEVGQVGEALDRLQPVLAAEPGNPEAVALLARLLDARRLAERSEAVQRAVTEAAAELAAGRLAPALVAANRALALDAGNQPALGVLGRAYREISRELLGARTSEPLPPAIRFSDLREVRDGGARVQVVRHPAFRLSGVVFDRSAVTITFHDEQGIELPGSSQNQLVGDYVLTEFSLQHRLKPDLTVLRLQATNSAGLSSSAEYSVLYARPVLRSPWFLALLVSLPLGAAGVLMGIRVARQRRLRRRKFNPYVAGAPVLDERLFFGRGPLLERILQTIHNNSLLLFGERRIGKTSLLHQLKRRLQALDDPSFAFFPVFVDLQGVPEDRFFATLMVDIREELEPILPPGTVEAVESRGGEYGYRELVDDLRAVLDALGRRTPKVVKLVLLIDEVDELNAYDPRINQRLRSLFMRAFSEHLVAVVSGVEIRKQWEKHGSPWYNFFEEIEVPPIDLAAAAALVRTPMHGMFTIDDEAIARILELTACKPYQIQKTCVALVNRLHAQGRTTICRADVEAVLGESSG